MGRKKTNQEVKDFEAAGGKVQKVATGKSGAKKEPKKRGKLVSVSETPESTTELRETADEVIEVVRATKLEPRIDQLMAELLNSNRIKDKSPGGLAKRVAQALNREEFECPGGRHWTTNLIMSRNN